MPAAPSRDFDFFDLDDLAAGAVLAVGIALVGLLLLNVVGPLIVLAGEVIVALVLLVIGVTGRVLLRRPWSVEAVQVGQEGDDPWVREVVGWRQSRRLITEVRASISRCGRPSLPEGLEAR